MRVRSLNKAKDDWSALRNHRMEHFGFAVSTEFYQHVPFFWNREGCQLNLIGHYRGSTAFMVCNGPSLVNSGYDLTKLKRPGIVTYGINNGAKTVRPNLWTCVDDPTRFLKSIWFDPCIMKIVPHSFAEKRIFDNEKWGHMKTVVGQCPNVAYFHRNEKFMANRWLYEDTINWGNHKDHGGGRTVMLAVFKVLFLLGFRNVFLLGADFNMSEDYTYHFDEQREKGAVKGNMNTYNKLQNEYLPELKKYFDAEGFNVYNCNPKSGLTVFDHVPYDEAIAYASSNLGDVDNERTWGMYSKPSEKGKWANEPQDISKPHLCNIANRVDAPIYIDTAEPIVAPVAPIAPVAPVAPVAVAPVAPIASVVPTGITIVPEAARGIVAKPMHQVPQALPEDSVPTQRPLPKAIPMKEIIPQAQEVRIDPRITMNQGPIVARPMGEQSENSERLGPPQPPQPPQPRLPRPPEQNSDKRIVRSLPCGGGISFGSSGVR